MPSSRHYHSGRIYSPTGSSDQRTWHIRAMVFKRCERPGDGDYIRLNIYASQLINGQSENKCFEIMCFLSSYLGDYYMYTCLVNGK